jgi:type III pantothenate kinase
MLLAIDIGNTHTVCGIWSEDRWLAIWRRATVASVTEDELVAWLRSMFDLCGLQWQIDGAVCGSVVPQVDATWSKLGERWLNVPVRFVKLGSEVGLTVSYDPPHAVGADRIANALAALERFKPPIIVVDFGTATTFDAIDASGVYAGGAILTGVTLSSEALFAKAAKLPTVPYVAPEFALGRNTVQALQSGIMLGYAGAIDTLATKIDAEMGGGAKIVATGGLGGLFLGLCASIESYEPTLTLDGLVIAAKRLSDA